MDGFALPGSDGAMSGAKIPAILFSVFFIVLNIAIDLGSIRLDPRMRKAQGGL